MYIHHHKIITGKQNLKAINAGIFLKHHKSTDGQLCKHLP